MAGRFHRVLLCAIPGVLALAGCWWLYSQRKKHASSSQEEEPATKEQQEEAPAARVEAVRNMDVVDTGCDMQKTVPHQNSKPEESCTEPDLVTWEIKVPEVSSCRPADTGCAMQKTVPRQNSKPEESSTKPDLVTWEIKVPKALVPRLIGKQGRFMNFLKQESGAKIYVSSPPHLRDSQVCHIEGFSQQVEKALSLIGEKFKRLCLTNDHIPPPPEPPPPFSLPMTCWLHLPQGVPVQVVVANQVNAGHMFLQHNTSATFHILHRLDQQMNACYSQPDIPTLPALVEVGTICAAPGPDGAWLRAQINRHFEGTGEVELRYVDYGGYDRVKIDQLRQIRSDFLSLPFQAAEVLLDNVVPLADQDHFSSQADAAVVEMTKGAALLAQATNCGSATGLPLVELWTLMGDEILSVNRALVERGLAQQLYY